MFDLKKKIKTSVGKVLEFVKSVTPVKKTRIEKEKPVQQKDNETRSIKLREEHSRGTILDRLLQKKLAAKAPKIELAGVTVDRNKWAVATIVLAVILAITVLTLAVQVNRFEKNMRILIVKLAPDGTHTVQFLKNRNMPTYFLNTLNSLMRQYVERRYSKLKDSITADYGFAYQFMAPRMRGQFMNEYNAVKVAQKFRSCSTCNQLQVKVTAIQHYESDDVVIHARPDREYRSTVFVMLITRNPDGSFLKKEKKIITLVWRIRTLEELNKNIGSVDADPIGLEILRASVRDDPQQ